VSLHLMKIQELFVKDNEALNITVLNGQTFYVKPDGDAEIHLSASVLADAWHTIEIGYQTDYLALVWSATIDSLSVSPGAVTTSRIGVHAQGVMGSTTTVPGSDALEDFDSFVRRGTALSVFTPDWGVAGLSKEPSARSSTGGEVISPGFYGARTPAAADTNYQQVWVGKHQSVNDEAVAIRVIEATVPNVSGLSKVAVAVSFLEIFTTSHIPTITGGLYALHYQDVRTLDPVQHYLPGWKQHLEVT